jgi:hypothetical protein
MGLWKYWYCWQCPLICLKHIYVIQKAVRHVVWFMAKLYITIFSYGAKLVNNSRNWAKLFIRIYVRYLTIFGKVKDPSVFVFKSLYKCGLSNLWIEHGTRKCNTIWIKTSVIQILRYEFLQKWHDDI